MDYYKYGNVMIDIETLSTHKNASIIEIAAVEFNKETGEIGDRFNFLIDSNEWHKNGRHIDGETLKWWFNQSDKARKRFVEKQEGVKYGTLYQALMRLRLFIMDCDSVDDDKNVVVWGNGSSFDIAILESAYNYFEVETPWNFWSVNDVRTIVDLKPSIKANYKFNGVKHSAVDDCIHQIGYLTETIKSLK